MKNLKKLKFILVLAMMLTFASHTYASEVTGNLSSSSTQGGSGSSSEVVGTIDNGKIAGNVRGGSSGGSSGGGSRGIVLGASTDITPTIFPPYNNFSSDGKALGTSTGDLATNTAPSTEVAISVPPDDSLISGDLAVNTAEGSSISNWLWMILLLLLLVAIIIYISTRTRKNEIRKNY